MTANRRTFAIISHPDAGKTTLTEKLLLQGGAIHLAGEVKARGQARRARSDWMKIEQQRGISVTSSVMTFEREGVVFNLLDTPGHEDFSEDTYRTLTAVDSAIMVIDAAKGIEPQTRKLFEVCRLRSVPIITFVNKVDREGRSPFETLDEVADALALDVVPMSWPVGMGGTFQGVLDFATRLVSRPEGDSREFLGLREAAELPAEGVVVYDQVAVPPTPEAQAVLAGAAPVLLPLFSPRSARLAAAACAGAAAPLRPLAISAAAASAWGRSGEAAPVAAAPDAAAMEALVRAAVAAEQSRGEPG